jgi:two-component SAPR family response regulator
VADGEWYDIVVLDIILREENGIEVAKELRLNGYDGNIIFWTAHKEYVFEALDLLPVHYIIKGSENGRMYTAFNHALEHISKKLFRSWNDKANVLFRTRIIFRQ